MSFGIGNYLWPTKQGGLSIQLYCQIIKIFLAEKLFPIESMEVLLSMGTRFIVLVSNIKEVQFSLVYKSQKIFVARRHKLDLVSLFVNILD